MSMTPSTKPVSIAGNGYTLKFNFGMACLAEQELGVSITKAFTADAPAMSTISVLWWAALQANHPMSRDQSNDLIDAAGLDQVSKWVIEGLTAYFNAGKPAAKAAKAGEPGKARTRK